MSAIAVRTESDAGAGAEPSAGPRGARLRAWFVSPAAGSLYICVLFLAISLWWVLTDVREPNNDNARHLLISNTWFDFISDGDILAPFREFVGYPPGVHLVGVPVQALFGLKMPAMVFAENLVFLPLLALGCYGTAKLAFGRTAGLLAVLFALAAPMLMSMFHVFMLDAPEAAMVAVTVWLLLLSDRFERPGIAALAGLAAAYGMYTKATFVLFVAGVVVVMLVRGGWRNWKGWLVFAMIVAIFAGPWYVQQLDVLRGATAGLAGPSAGAGSGGPPAWYGGIRYPERDTLWNYQWYGWSLVNHTLYLPLTLFFATGVGWALWRLRSAAGRASPIPELLVGGLGGYLGVSMIVLKDPRYSLPCLVYIAVLAVGWIAALPRKPRLVAAALLACVFVLNTVTHNFGVGGAKTIEFGQPRPGNPIGQNTLTVFRDSGYFEGPPVRSHARFVDLLNRLHDERGVREAILDKSTFASPTHSTVGTMVLVKSSKLALAGFHPNLLKGPADVKEPTDAWIVRLPIAAALQEPCILAPGDDGAGIYVYVGRTPDNYQTVKPDCP